MNLKFLSRIGFFLAVLGVVVLILNDSILAEGYFAIALQALAVLLMIWARLTFGVRSFHASADPTDGELVTSGPYKYFRHPIYAALLYFMWAGILSHISLLNIFAGIVASVGLMLRIFAEERLLKERYPKYAEYSAKTKRIIPLVF